MVRYCSKECQRTDWPEHKGICDASCLLESNLKVQSTFAQGFVSGSQRVQKRVQELRKLLQESPERRRAGGHSKEAENKPREGNSSEPVKDAGVSARDDPRC